MYVFLTEVFGVFLAIQLVQMLTGIRQFVCAGHHQRVVGVVDDAFQVGHLHRVYLRSHMVTHKEQFGVGVIDDVVYLLCHELVQDGYCHGAVCQRGQERHCPLAAVASAEGYLVALGDATVLKQNV